MAFVLHIPAMKYLTTPAKSSNMLTYAHLTDGITGETYQIKRIVFGRPLKILYDPQEMRK